MDERKNNNQEIEIDLQRLLGALLNKAWLIGTVAIVCAVAALLSTILFITPKYQSAAMFYVNNNSVSLGEAALSITASDISASKSLVDSYIVILKTRETLNDVIDYAGVERTYGAVKGMISASAVDSTEIFQVVVTSEDPQEAKEIADAIAYILPKRIASIIEGTSAKVVDSAVLPSGPCSPGYTKNTMLGFAIGLVAAVVFVTLRVMMDITIRTEEDIAQSCKYPVLAAVPDMVAHSDGESRPAFLKRKSDGSESKSVELIGGGISFAAAESYKLLRTKLQFSFADEKNCRIIGVSSALTGEGKSLSSINLAYSISQLGKKTLLIDCDLRRSSLAEKLSIHKTPGLSDFLAGQVKEDQLIQPCGLAEGESMFWTISAGRTPPNPMELLSSTRMEKLLAKYREEYDYILLDLPPVGEVGDALAAVKLTDGMLIVVRQNYCDRLALHAAIHQFEFMESKLLGVVFNCTTEEGNGYGNKYYNGYYRKYYKRYYRAYDNANNGSRTGTEKPKVGAKKTRR